MMKMRASADDPGAALLIDLGARIPTQVSEQLRAAADHAIRRAPILLMHSTIARSSPARGFSFLLNCTPSPKDSTAGSKACSQADRV